MHLTHSIKKKCVNWFKSSKSTTKPTTLPAGSIILCMSLIFQMPNVQPDQADTYKCFAVNEFGQAVVTVVLNVIEGKDCSLAIDM